MLFVFCGRFVLGCVLLGVALERDEFAHKVLVHVHHGGIVVEVATVVFGAEDGHKLLVFAEEAITIFHDLMASADEVQIVPFEELVELLLAEDPTAASFVLFPVSHVFVWIVPEQVGD